MRKKTLGIIAVTLTASMLAASLTGCGTRAEATDQEVVIEEEPINVTDEEDSEEVTIETEDEITETEEVIADDVEANTDASYTEHEYFFALDETDISTEEELDLSTLVPVQETHELKDSVTLYGSGRAVIIGYTKPNITVTLMSTSDKWYSIYFADEEPAYQIVLVKAEDFIEASGMYENMPAVTADDVKMTLINQLYDKVGDADGVHYVALDDTVEEMNLTDEFTIPTYCRDIDEALTQIVADNDFENYRFFHIEKVSDKSDDENSCFRVSYGVLQEFAE